MKDEENQTASGSSFILHPCDFCIPKNRQIGSNRRPGAVPPAALVDGTTQSARVARMAQASSFPPRPPSAVAMLEPPPNLRLELRHGSARPVIYEVSDLGFLIGSVPGCDPNFRPTRAPTREPAR